MKSIKVVAAIIKRGDTILATQRGYGDMKGGWEFPGGKVEPGETSQQALKREIEEELECELDVGRFVIDVNHDYDTFHLDMDCFECTVASGTITLLEHSAARWLDKDHLRSVAWLPADAKVVTAIEAQGLL